MSSITRTHWCYRCRCPVRLRGEHTICSNCAGGFVQELNEMEDIGASEFLGLASDSNGDNEQRAEIMEALSGLVRRRLDRRNHELSIRGLSELIPEDGLESGSSPWLIFRGQIPVRMAENGGVEVLLDSTRNGGREATGAELSVGRELDELIEQLTTDDTEGTSPASKSSIDAMPTINISQTHIQADSQCPICIERFELGSQARQMPCNHIYHSTCIVPWLVRRNSCPICRRQLLQQESTSADSFQSLAGGSIRTRATAQTSGTRTSRASINTNGSRNSRTGMNITGAHGTGVTINSNGLRNNVTSDFNASNVSGRENSWEQRRSNGSSWQSSSAYEVNYHEMNYSGWPFDY